MGRERMMLGVAVALAALSSVPRSIDAQASELHRHTVDAFLRRGAG